jgi:hypothetical protein
MSDLRFSKPFFVVQPDTAGFARLVGEAKKAWLLGYRADLKMLSDAGYSYSRRTFRTKQQAEAALPKMQKLCKMELHVAEVMNVSFG